MKTLYIFRHGETDWNSQLKFQGHTDIPLNEKGRTQALILSEKIKNCSPQIILTSDLTRALDTAHIANQHIKVPVIVAPALRECNLGKAEGLPREIVKSTFGEDTFSKWASHHNEHEHFGFPEGETKHQHKKRLLDYLETFIQSSQEKIIAISTHGGSIYRFLSHCHNSPHEKVYPVVNCDLFKITVDNKIWTFHERVK